jgi:1-acyl-sn-glycerol-3-phosphate acyltransferase
MKPAVHPCAGLLAFAARFISGVNTCWIDCHPEPRQRIYFANHSSHLDFVVLWSALPPEIRAATRPVAAKDYWDRNKVKLYIASTVFRAVLIERPESGRGQDSARTMLRSLFGALDEGSSLIIFPEGRRSDGTGVGEFKAGLFHLCRHKPEIEAVPVYLENLNRVLPKGEFLPAPLLSRVRFGAPLTLQSQEPKDQFLERARTAVCSLKDS